MRAALVIGTVAALAAATPAWPQQVGDQPTSADPLTSPIPRVRVIRPAEPPSEAQVEPPDEPEVFPPIEALDQPVAEQLPSGTAEGTEVPADTDPPGDASQVRVVYGSTRPSAGPLPETQRVPVLLPEGEDDDEAASGDPNEPAWKRDRAKRFRRAPEREYPPGFQVTAPIVPIETPDTQLMSGARLRQLDKMTGQTETFDIAVGRERKVSRLRIRLDACRAPGDNDTHGTIAYLNIWDTKHPEDPPAFNGWMFADSPALSALDHPRYDLWVISCTTSAAEASASRE